jgi:hypothetical protein
MTGADALVRRIDQELAAEAGRKKAAWAEVVIRHARCPVMVVKSPAHRAAPPVSPPPGSPGTPQPEGVRSG